MEYFSKNISIKVPRAYIFRLFIGIIHYSENVRSQNFPLNEGEASFSEEGQIHEKNFQNHRIAR